LQVAAQAAPDFPEGVFVVELAPVGDPAAVANAVAVVLGVVQQAEMTMAETLATALEGRKRLLLLDNCEHVLDAAGELVEAILGRSATVKVLVTSREGLAVRGEHLHRVRSMGAEDVTDDAVRLFVERAQALEPGFDPAGEEAEAMLDICRCLDGIPLAIELAAARMLSMTAIDVRDRLDDRFKLLGGSRRGLERHQTLRQAVGWSYELLDDDERTLLCRCSVFAGGFDLAAAVAVGGGGRLDEYQVLDVLDSLVRKSLLEVGRSSPKARYSMLETIRQFSVEQLAASGAAGQVRDLHARYYAGLEPTVMATWNSSRQRDAHLWLEVELANLRSAFRWSADHGDLDSAATIAVAASLLGYSTGNGETTAWAEELLDAARRCEHPLLVALYQSASRQLSGRVAEAAIYTDLARALYDDPRFERNRYGCSAANATSAYFFIGRADLCVQANREDIQRGDDSLGSSRSFLAIGLAMLGQHEEAVSVAREAMQMAESTDNPTAVLAALIGYGFAQATTDPAGAIAAWRREAHLASEVGHRTGYLNGLLALVHLEIEHDIGQALIHLAEVVPAWHNIGDILSLRVALTDLCIALGEAGQPELAAVVAGFARSPHTMVVTSPTLPQFPDYIDRLTILLGEDTFDALATRGAEMSTAEAVRYALDSIDQAKEMLLEK
jgi:predicted ATPase